VRGKCIPKIAIFGDIFKATNVNVSVIAGTWETLPMPNFVKIA